MVFGHEFLIAGRLGGLDPAVTGEDAVDLVPERLLEGADCARPAREIDRLRLVTDRGICLHLADGVLEDRSAQDDVCLRGLHRSGDRGEVRLGRRIDLLVDGLDPGRLETRLGTILRG